MHGMLHSVVLLHVVRNRHSRPHDQRFARTVPRRERTRNSGGGRTHVCSGSLRHVVRPRDGGLYADVLDRSALLARVLHENDLLSSREHLRIPYGMDGASSETGVRGRHSKTFRVGVGARDGDGNDDRRAVPRHPRLGAFTHLHDVPAVHVDGIGAGYMRRMHRLLPASAKRMVATTRASTGMSGRCVRDTETSLMTGIAGVSHGKK